MHTLVVVFSCVSIHSLLPLNQSATFAVPSYIYPSSALLSCYSPYQPYRNEHARSEESDFLLLSVLLPLLLCVPFLKTHAEDLNELSIGQVVLLLGWYDILGELVLELAVGELVGLGVKLASEGIGLLESLGGGGLGLLLKVGSDNSWVGLDPLGCDLRLPLDELNLERGGLVAS